MDNTEKETCLERRFTKENVSSEEGVWLLPGFPVALVCVGRNILTVAAISFFSWNPPSIMIGIVPSRYSFGLIKETGDFSVNIPEKGLIDKVKYCGSSSGREIDKFKESNLTAVKSDKISSFLIDECPVNLECKVIHTFEVEKASHVWFVGEVVSAHRRSDYKRKDTMIFWAHEYRSLGEVIKSSDG